MVASAAEMWASATAGWLSEVMVFWRLENRECEMRCQRGAVVAIIGIKSGKGWRAVCTYTICAFSEATLPYPRQVCLRFLSPLHVVGV